MICGKPLFFLFLLFLLIMVYFGLLKALFLYHDLFDRSCPKCTYLLIVDNDTKVVKCPDCSLISCRLCGEEPHKNQSCEEAKAEREKSNVREKMANAMTEAVVRQCPGCKCKIMKSTGCNKMTCSNRNCQTKFCYVCRKKIRDYEHFCRAP